MNIATKYNLWAKVSTITYLIAYLFVLIFFMFVIYTAMAFVMPGKLDDRSLNTYVPPLEVSDGQDNTERVAPVLWSAPEPDFARMKSAGCVADGLLSEYNEPEVDIPLVAQSNCYYFHRALETWLEPPDFARAISIIDEIDRDDVVYGMFIAEAIDTKADYEHRAQERAFDFKEMCRRNSKNYWGEHTCIPELED